MNRLDGKIALISGAGRGIGAATAKLMIEAGAKVIIGDIIEKEGQELAEKLGPNASFIRLDVTMEEDWERAVDIANSSFGGLDILANNAGLFLGRDTRPSKKEIKPAKSFSLLRLIELGIFKYPTPLMLPLCK